MNRRQFLGTAGVITAGVSGYTGLRLSNIRRYTPTDTVDESLPVGERIYEASRLLSVVDYRAVSTVTVQDDGTDDAPYKSERFRYEQQRSRHRYLQIHSVFNLASGTPWTPLTSHPLFIETYRRRLQNDDLPKAQVLYLSAGTQIFGQDIEPLESRMDRPHVSSGSVNRGVGLGERGGSPHQARLRPYIHSPDGEWSQRDNTTETVTYEVSGRDDYAMVVPVEPALAIGEDSRLTVTLDRQTGRLLRIIDHRTVDQESDTTDNDVMTFRYTIETEFDQYGATNVQPPSGPVPTPSLINRLRELRSNLMFY